MMSLSSVPRSLRPHQASPSAGPPAVSAQPGGRLCPWLQQSITPCSVPRASLPRGLGSLASGAPLAGRSPPLASSGFDLSFRSPVPVPRLARSSLSSQPSFLSGRLCLSPPFLFGLCFGCFRVSPLSPLACPGPPLFPCPSSSRVGQQKTQRKAAGRSFPHPPHPYAPAFWKGPESACLPAPSQGLVEGSLRGGSGKGPVHSRSRTFYSFLG